MAKETITIVRDDLDGSENAKSYKFGWGDDQYEIDLSENNAKELQDFLAKYMSAGAKVTARLPRSGGSPAPKSNKEELARVREWAAKEGLKVNPRGRISGDVLKAYQDAH